MSELHPIRRIVTAHSKEGIATVETDSEIPAEVSILWIPGTTLMSRRACKAPASKEPVLLQYGLPRTQFPLTTITIGMFISILRYFWIYFIFHSSEDGAQRKIDDPTNFALVHPTGTNLRTTELAPGAVTAMVLMAVLSSKKIAST